VEWRASERQSVKWRIKANSGSFQERSEKKGQEEQSHQRKELGAISGKDENFGI